MIKHRSMAFLPYFPRWEARPSEVSKHFRFVVRLAVACHESGTDYDVAWTHSTVTITCQGDKIPTPRPLPKEKRSNLVAEWRPKQWEAEYRLECCHDAKLNRLTPGFVLEHSSGLSLVMPCSTGEWGTETGDADPNGKWHVTHTASGKGFGLSLPINKAADCLVFAASQPVDWTLSIDELRTAGGPVACNVTLAQFGDKATREQAERRLERLQATAPLQAAE